MTNSKGETKTYSLSSSEIEQLQTNMSKLTANSSGVAASKDLTGDRLQSIVQDGLNKGQDVNTTMKNIVQNKDAYHSGSVAMTENLDKKNIDNNQYIERGIIPTSLVNQEITKEELDDRMKNGGRGKNARELKENLENIKDKMTSTYSADGTITNSEGEKRAWTSSSPHYKGNTPTPDGSAGNIDTPTKGITVS